MSFKGFFFNAGKYEDTLATLAGRRTLLCAAGREI